MGHDHNYSRAAPDGQNLAVDAGHTARAIARLHCGVLRRAEQRARASGFIRTSFLRGMAESISDELALDEPLLEQAWQGTRGASVKLQRFLEKQVLPGLDKPLVLAIDEADGLLQSNFYTDFFGLLRSWHNRRATNPEWEKFNLVLVISTEPYLLIADVNQSPFNVGLHLGLSDFTVEQVRDLNLRHGVTRGRE